MFIFSNKHTHTEKETENVINKKMKWNCTRKTLPKMNLIFIKSAFAGIANDIVVVDASASVVVEFIFLEWFSKIFPLFGCSLSVWRDRKSHRALWLPLKTCVCGICVCDRM